MSIVQCIIREGGKRAAGKARILTTWRSAIPEDLQIRCWPLNSIWNGSKFNMIQKHAISLELKQIVRDWRTLLRPGAPLDYSSRQRPR